MKKQQQQQQQHQNESGIDITMTPIYENKEQNEDSATAITILKYAAENEMNIVTFSALSIRYDLVSGECYLLLIVHILFILLFFCRNFILSFFLPWIGGYECIFAVFGFAYEFYERCAERIVKNKKNYNSKDAGRITIFDSRTIILFQQQQQQQTWKKWLKNEMELKEKQKI